MDDNVYKQLTEDEKQICDLCRDWNLGECEECELVSRYYHKKIKQEVKQNERLGKTTSTGSKI